MDVMNVMKSRKLLILLGPVLGLVMFAATVKMASSLMHGGATVNGEPSQAVPLMPKNDAERY